MQTIHRMRCEFRPPHTVTVDAIFAPVDAVTVVTITTFITVKNEITVLILPGVVRVVAILVVGVCSRKTRIWHRTRKFFVLFKKGFVEVIVATIGKRIPSIAPPSTLRIHGESGIFPKIGDHGFFGKPTDIFVQMHLIHRRLTTKLPTIGTVGRLRKRECVLPNFWRKHLEECTIFIGYCVRRLALFTVKLHSAKV